MAEYCNGYIQKTSIRSVCICGAILAKNMLVCYSSRRNDDLGSSRAELGEVSVGVNWPFDQHAETESMISLSGFSSMTFCLTGEGAAIVFDGACRLWSRNIPHSNRSAEQRSCSLQSRLESRFSMIESSSLDVKASSAISEAQYDVRGGWSLVYVVASAREQMTRSSGA